MVTGDRVYFYRNKRTRELMGAPIGTLVDPKTLTREQLLDALLMTENLVGHPVVIRTDCDNCDDGCDGNHFAACDSAALGTEEKAIAMSDDPWM